MHEQSEDCLTLNIWKRRDAGTGLPVMVYIHGGAFISGGSADPLYDGANFAAGHDVVIVTLNYRISLFGSLCLTALLYGSAWRRGLRRSRVPEHPRSDLRPGVDQGEHRRLRRGPGQHHALRRIHRFGERGPACRLPSRKGLVSEGDMRIRPDRPVQDQGKGRALRRRACRDHGLFQRCGHAGQVRGGPHGRGPGAVRQASVRGFPDVLSGMRRDASSEEAHEGLEERRSQRRGHHDRQHRRRVQLLQVLLQAGGDARLLARSDTFPFRRVAWHRSMGEGIRGCVSRRGPDRELHR